MKLHVSPVSSVLAADDAIFAHRVDVELSIASLDAKVCPHARGELRTKADEICGRWSNPYVDTSVVSEIACDVWAKQGVEGFTLGDGESIDGS